MTDIDRRLPRRQLLLQGLSATALASAWPAQAAPAPEDPFRTAYFETYRPLSFVDGGAMRGILVDVLEEVLGRRLGLRCEHEGYPWLRAQRLVEVGQRDAICTIATPERLAYAVAASEPVITAPTCIFVRGDNPRAATFAQARNLDELRELKPSVISYIANGWAKNKLGGFDVAGSGDFNSAIKMLIARRGDIMIENVLVMSYVLARTPGGDAVQLLPNRMDRADFQLLIGKSSPHVQRSAQIAKVLRLFKQTPAYDDVFKRYGLPLMG